MPSNSKASGNICQKPLTVVQRGQPRNCSLLVFLSYFQSYSSSICIRRQQCISNQSIGQLGSSHDACILMMDLTFDICYWNGKLHLCYHSMIILLRKILNSLLKKCFHCLFSTVIWVELLLQVCVIYETNNRKRGKSRRETDSEKG